MEARLILVELRVAIGVGDGAGVAFGVAHDGRVPAEWVVNAGDPAVAIQRVFRRAAVGSRLLRHAAGAVQQEA